MLPSPFLYRTAVISLALSLITGAWYFLMADGMQASEGRRAPPILALTTVVPAFSGETAATPSSAPAAPTIAAAPPTPAPTSTPTPAPTPTPTPLPTVTYTVEAGDSLLAIAGRFGVKAEDLIQANALKDPDAIAIGQKLVIPR